MVQGAGEVERGAKHPGTKLLLEGSKPGRREIFSEAILVVSVRNCAYNPRFWEAKAGGSPEVRILRSGSRPAYATW